MQRDTSTAAIADHVAAAIAGKAAAHIAVPGGRSPGPVFAELAARDLDWDGSEIWLTDDRCVPAGHAASNLGLLTSHLGGAGATIVPLTQKARPPRFDLVWIGMGADGHIASLFPNMDPQPGGAPAIVRDTPDPLPPEAPFDRVSLNIAALTNADAIMLLITGDEKKSRARRRARGRQRPSGGQADRRRDLPHHDILESDMSINPVVESVTARIIEKSRPSRKTYLELIDLQREAGVHRPTLSCGNLAHGFAASGEDKPVIRSWQSDEHRHCDSL